jgi:hypothetical protein
MSVWTNGISVLKEEWKLVIAILVFVFTGASLISFLLRKLIPDRLTSIEYFSLGLAGWLIPASLVSLLWYFTGFNWIAWILPIAWVLYVLLRLKPDLEPASVSRSLFLALAVLVSVFLRLVYVAKALFPLYFDSAQHYSVIKNIMQQNAAWMLNWLNAAYYHLGFHFLSALFASVLDVGATRVMLVLGQVILALIPFSVFFLVKYISRSSVAGGLAVVLSAFGWYMPAHAVDWGKYPALMSVGMISFVLSLAYLVWQHKDTLTGRKRGLLYILLGVSALLTVFAHSRSLIFLGIVIFVWFISTWWQKLSPRWMSFVFVLVVLITLAEVVYVQSQSILTLLVDPYLQKGYLVTGFVVFLSIFAWMVYPRLTFVSVLTMAFLLGSVFVPVTFIPGYRDLTLLDRPFVEMVLFLPLSLLGGLGTAGMEQKLQGRFAWSRLVSVFAVGVLLVNAFVVYDLYPSDCCVIVGNDDVVAMDWVANQLPVDARIGIASTALKVMPSETPEGDVGADAGIWITPMTGRLTIPLPNGLEFGQQATPENLCELKIGYLYVGEKGQPFSVEKIASRPEWYRPLLSMPKTRVYEVVGCQ